MLHNEKVSGDDGSQNNLHHRRTRTVGLSNFGDNLACIHESDDGLKNISDIMTDRIILHILRNYGARVKSPLCIGRSWSKCIRTPCEFRSAFCGYNFHIGGEECCRKLRYVRQRGTPTSGSE